MTLFYCQKTEPKWRSSMWKTKYTSVAIYLEIIVFYMTLSVSDIIVDTFVPLLFKERLQFNDFCRDLYMHNYLKVYKISTRLRSRFWLGQCNTLILFLDSWQGYALFVFWQRQRCTLWPNVSTWLVVQRTLFQTSCGLWFLTVEWRIL